MFGFELSDNNKPVGRERTTFRLGNDAFGEGCCSGGSNCDNRYSRDAYVVFQKYGVVCILTLVMFLAGVLLNLLSDKNPPVIPHPSWCEHSSLHAKHLQTIGNITLKAMRSSTSTIAPSSQTEEGSGDLYSSTSLPTPTQPIFNMETMYIPTMPKGLSAAAGTFCFSWPLLPLLLNSRTTMNNAKIESIISHVLGQATNFGLAEVFRTQIAYPESLFLEKCNISPLECLQMSQNKVALPLYIPSQKNNSSAAMCRGQYYNNDIYVKSSINSESGVASVPAKKKTFNDGKIIYNSLHHYPDPVCMMFGASIVSFIVSIIEWDNMNPRRKKLQQSSATVRSILTMSDIATMSSMLFYIYNLYVTHDMAQLLGLFVGTVLQLLINRTVSYHSKHLRTGQEDKEEQQQEEHEMLPLKTQKPPPQLPSPPPPTQQPKIIKPTAV